MTEHINKQYDQDLEAIRSPHDADGRPRRVPDPRRHRRATSTATSSAPTQVIAGDAKVNELELAIDNDLGQIIVRRQPAASDLRLILAASKIVTDLERIGDEADQDRAHGPRHPRQAAPRRARASWPIGHVSEVAIGMLRRVARRVRAPRRRGRRARARRGRRHRRGVPRDPAPAHHLHDGRPAHHHARRCSVVWVAKAFERIGDHAKNIAEYVIYIVKGRDVRHIPLAELEREALGR